MTISTSKRLLLRLGTSCNNGCDHCTVGDLRSLSDRDTDTIVRALEAGRKAQCTEVVFLRGEPTIREDFLALCRSARSLGFERVQVQSNGRMFAVDGFLERARSAGLTHAETSIYGPDAAIHDAIAKASGAFAQSSLGMARLADAGMLVQVNVPLVEANAHTLASIVDHAADQGAPRVQFNFQRPVDGSPTSALRLSRCREPLEEALMAGSRREVDVTTEAIPLCLLPPGSACASDAWSPSDAPQILIDDLHRRTEDIAGLRATHRGQPAPCAGCSDRDRCPTTWSRYFEAHGSDELAAR